MKSIDELAANLGFTTAKTGEDRTVTFLPEPRARETRIHGDLGRRPHRRAARHVRGPGAGEVRRPGAEGRRRPTTAAQTWVYDGQELPTSASTPSSGGRCSEYGFEPARFDEMRRGAWDIHARVADMDLNGVYASLNFPSFLPGFAGQRLQQVTKDPELALARCAAWNDWHLEEWAGPYPDRIIPCQIPWLLDPEVGGRR